MIVAIILVVGLNTLASAAALADIAPDAVPIVEHFVLAVGGRSALQTTHSLRLRCSVSTAGLSGIQETWKAFPDREREHTELGPYKLGNGFDGGKGWRIGPDGVLSALDGKELEDARADTYFDNWAWLATDQGGGKVVSLGARQDSTGAYAVLDVAPPAGKHRTLWFNPSTGLLARVVETDGRPEVIADYSDYRSFDGLRLPGRTVIHIVGMPANTILSTTDSVWVNPAIPADFFAAPESKQASVRYRKTPGYAQIPFRYDLRLIWIRASINGAPPADFIFDSGASTTVIDSAYAATNGIEAVGQAETQGAGAVGHASLAKLRSVRIDAPDGDGVELTDRTAVVIPISASITPTLWHEVAGVLGYDAIREFVVTVDFDHSTLRFNDPAQFRYTGSGTKLPFTLAGGVPVVPMRLDDRYEGNFRVDLGSAGATVLQGSFAARSGIHPSHVVTAAGTGFGGRYPVRLFRMKSLELGPLRWKDPIVAISQATAGVLATDDYAGLIGNQVLERFTCTFDYEHRALYLEPGVRPFQRDRFTRVGLILTRSGSAVRATQVMDGSPAERAGLRVGDMIQTIDDRPVTAWDLDALRKRFEETSDAGNISIGISREGKAQVMIVHKKTLL